MSNSQEFQDIIHASVQSVLTAQKDAVLGAEFARRADQTTDRADKILDLAQDMLGTAQETQMKLEVAEEFERSNRWWRRIALVALPLAFVLAIVVVVLSFIVAG